MLQVTTEQAAIVLTLGQKIDDIERLEKMIAVQDNQISALRRKITNCVDELTETLCLPLDIPEILRYNRDKAILVQRFDPEGLQFEIIDIYTPEGLDVSVSVMSPELKGLFDLVIELDSQLEKEYTRIAELTAEVQTGKALVSNAMGLPEGIYCLNSMEYLKVSKVSVIHKSVSKESFYIR
jgi:regulator of replication initiation timing